MDEALAIPGTRACGVGELALRRLAAGELALEEEKRLRAHLEGCARCARAFAQVEREAAQFFAGAPFAAFERAVRARATARPRRRFRLPVALALAAALAVGLLAAPLRTALDARAGRNGLKGGLPAASLEVYVGGAGAAPRLAQSGEALSPGERIRVGYHAADGRYLLVLSVDQRGEVTPIYPEAGRSLKAESGNQVHLLPDSVELTGQGWERLVILFSQEPLDVARAEAAARAEFARARSLESMTPLPLEAEERSLLLKKP